MGRTAFASSTSTFPGASYYPVNLPLPAMEWNLRLLIQQRAMFDHTIAAFERSIEQATKTAGSGVTPTTIHPPKRTMSAATRKKLAQKARETWAKKNAAAATAGAGEGEQPTTTGKRGPKPKVQA